MSSEPAHAVKEEGKEKKRGFGRVVLSFLLAIAIVFGLTFLLRMFVVESYGIPSGSMENTIQIGDLVYTEKVSYKFSKPQVGDIVTFKDQEHPSRILIKRVVATEGQTVNLVDGSLYVDGVKQNESYTEGKPTYPLNKNGTNAIQYPYTVPQGYVFVMGDNRTNSQDSRYFGAVPVSDIIGKAVFTYWPINHIGALN